MKKTKFVFLIPAYNCKKEIKQTMFSIFAQSYDNWRAIIIDDMSTDNTYEAVGELSASCGFGGKVRVKKREEKFGEVRNTIEEVFNHIDDDEVVVRLDGGDWLTENDTLHYLNEIYNHHNPSVCWTGQRWAYSSYGISKEMNLKPNQTVYNHPWVSSHLKTFRAAALKKVNKQNFFDDDGNWIMIACDQAVFLPMMHLAHKNNKPLVFFPLICYHYNIDLERPTLFTEDRSLKQKQSAEWIRARGYVK
jgi:glycosyltransferase involved in cell wall biosynthesis